MNKIIMTLSLVLWAFMAQVLVSGVCAKGSTWWEVNHFLLQGRLEAAYTCLF
jgi:hypothetical protein